MVYGKPDSVFNLFRGGVKTGKGRLSGVLLCERKDRRGQCLRAGCNESGKRRRNFHFAEAGRNGMTIAIVKYDWKLERELAKEYRIDEQ